LNDYRQKIKTNNFSFLFFSQEIIGFAENLGYSFKWNTSSKGLQPTFYLKIAGKIKEYHILAFNEFTGNRKKVSVLFRDPNAESIDGAILIVR